MQFQSVKSGDVVIGQISAIQDSGLTVQLRCLDVGRARDVDDLELSAFCATRDVPRIYAHEAPLNGYAIKDYVRGKWV